MNMPHTLSFFSLLNSHLQFKPDERSFINRLDVGRPIAVLRRRLEQGVNRNQYLKFTDVPKEDFKHLLKGRAQALISYEYQTSDLFLKVIMPGTAHDCAARSFQDSVGHQINLVDVRTMLIL